MFFVLSKLLGVFAFPSNLAILIGILGLLLLPTRFARAGRWLAFVSLLVLAILGLSPVGNMLMIPLENRFPLWDAARGAPDGIIVLGGVIDASSPGNQIMLNESAEELHIRALRLAGGHLWQRRFDLALLPRWDPDYHHSAFVAYFSGAICRVGSSENVTPRKQQYDRGLDILFTRTLDDRTCKHEVERNLHLLRQLGGHSYG
jgi:hypothetical protein